MCIKANAPKNSDIITVNNFFRERNSLTNYLLKMKEDIILDRKVCFRREDGCSCGELKWHIYQNCELNKQPALEIPFNQPLTSTIAAESAMIKSYRNLPCPSSNLYAAEGILGRNIADPSQQVHCT